MSARSCTTKENEHLFPVLSMPSVILSTPLILYLHYLFFQIEESQCISRSLFGSCAKTWIILIMFLCVSSSSTYILSERSWIEHSSQNTSIMMVFVLYFFPHNSQHSSHFLTTTEHQAGMFTVLSVIIPTSLSGVVIASSEPITRSLNLEIFFSLLFSFFSILMYRTFHCHFHAWYRMWYWLLYFRLLFESCFLFDTLIRPDF